MKYYYPVSEGSVVVYDLTYCRVCGEEPLVYTEERFVVRWTDQQAAKKGFMYRVPPVGETEEWEGTTCCESCYTEFAEEREACEREGKHTSTTRE